MQIVKGVVQCNYMKMAKKYIYSINTFPIDMCLFNNIPQMTSKCGKNKNLGHMERNTKLKI